MLLLVLRRSGRVGYCIVVMCAYVRACLPVVGMAILLVVTAGEMSGCVHHAGNGRDVDRPRPRTLDPAVRTYPLEPPLAPGTAVAFFALDTGADQLGGRPEQAGLVVVVRFGSRELRQTIASCTAPALGSALGGGDGVTLEVALCDDEYRLVSQPGHVLVYRVDEAGGLEGVTRIALPDPELRAVTPASEPTHAEEEEADG